MQLFGWLEILMFQAYTGQTPLLWMQVMYLHRIQDYGLHQLVTSPTRGTNILDLFLTNDPSTVINIEMLPGISEYEIVSAVMSIVPRVLKLSKQKVYLCNKAHWDKIRSELESMVASFLLIDNVNDNVHHPMGIL